MMRRFHLYPDNAEQQRLGASQSLALVHELDGFSDTIAPFSVTIEVAPAEDQLHGKWQEYIVRPPLEQHRVKEFGEALIGFAEKHGLDHHQGVLFVDHTNPIQEELRQAIARKVGPQREQEGEE